MKSSTWDPATHLKSQADFLPGCYTIYRNRGWRISACDIHTTATCLFQEIKEQEPDQTKPMSVVLVYHTGAISVLAVLLPIQLPACGAARQKPWSKPLGPRTNMGEKKKSPGSQFLASEWHRSSHCSHWKSKPADGRLISLFFSLHFYISNKLMKQGKKTPLSS